MTARSSNDDDDDGGDGLDLGFEAQSLGVVLGFETRSFSIGHCLGLVTSSHEFKPVDAVRKDINTSRQMVPVAVTASYSVDEDNEDKVYCHHHTLVCYVHK